MQKNKIKDNRIFRLMNTFLDVLFMVFICLGFLLISSYALRYQEGFVLIIKLFIMICGWTEVILSILSLLTELLFFAKGHKMYIGRTIWTIIRAVLTFLLLFVIFFTEHFFEGAFTINL